MRGEDVCHKVRHVGSGLHPLRAHHAQEGLRGTGKKMEGEGGVCWLMRRSMRKTLWGIGICMWGNNELCN